jgi:hypothetical protein
MAQSSQKKNLVVHLFGVRGLEQNEQAVQTLTDGEMLRQDGAGMLVLMVHPQFVQRERMADIESEHAPALGGCVLELLVVCFAAPHDGRNVNGIIASLAQHIGQSQVDIFVQQEFYIHV